MIKKPEQVHTRSEFSQYVDYLLNAMGGDKEKSENVTVTSFLVALSAYSKDVDGYYKNMNIPIDPDKPSWRLFADLITGATIYE